MTIDEELEQAHSAALSVARSAAYSVWSASERLKQVEMIKEML